MSQTKAQLIDTLVASLLPASDSAVDIGSNAVRFANIYGDTLYGSGANLTGLNIVTDTSPQLGGNLDVNTKNILFGDSVNTNDDRLKFGAGEDLQIYHDGTISRVQDDTNHLYVKGVNITLFKGNSAEKFIDCITDGAVELYHDNSKKLNTNTNGVHITDTLTFANTGDSVLLADNQKVSCGNGGDLKIYHDSNNSVIDSNTGNLYISSANSFFLQGSSNDNIIKYNANGAVELYYDNVKKIETTSDGISVTGSITGTGHLDLGDDARLKMGTSDDLEIFHSGGNSFISNSTGYLLVNTEAGDSVIRASNNVFLQPVSGESGVIAKANGAVELYYDNSKKIETLSGGIDVTGRVTTDELTVEKASGNLSTVINAQNGLGTIEISGSTGAFIDFKSPSSDDFDLRIGTDGTAGYILAAGTGIISIQGHPTPSANNTYDIGSNTNKWKEIFSTKFIHRYGTSGSATPNEQEAIWYGGGITVMHDNATLSTSNYTWGLTGSRGYALLRIRNNAGSPQAIYAEAGSITSGSDYRMKENIEEITNGIETVKKLKPSIYNIRKTFNPNDDGKKHHGFVAHEVQEAIPNIGNIVSGTKDAMEEVFYEDEDENIPAGKKAGDSTGTFTDKPDYQGIDYGHMTPILAAAIKELITKVETLESENTSLKTRVTTLESA